MIFDEITQHQQNRDFWEEAIYAKGNQMCRYPFDAVVSFVFRNLPEGVERSDVRILEAGCGAGNNLWFAAREGFKVAGVDGSPSAIDYARRRFEQDGLECDFRVADFTRLPFKDNTFDLSIERGALVCCSFEMARKAVHELRRVLKKGGRAFFNPYSREHTSFLAGRVLENGMVTEIRDGTLQGVGDLCFYDEAMVCELLREWRIHRLEHLMIECRKPSGEKHAEWRVIAERT